MDVLRTASFERRLLEVADGRARSRINVAAQRMREGNFGDSKAVGHGVIETRIHYGPGYRIYYSYRGAELVLLLLCGDKRTQQRDIARAIILSETLKI
ncbi:MAG TPA: type II toxin-antitoxin system RelE/ParE family toxin [Rudaea sp.]|jgi:putative addiction module killer protein|nr:type II toxin-antitoxin system RelE/ParE family toxin [Rudaea sp.]